MRTIFITSFHVLASRNILSSSLLDLLKKNNWRVVVIVPEKKREFIAKHYGGGGVEVYGLKNPLTRLDTIFRGLAMAAIRTRSLKVMRRRNMGLEWPLLQKLFFWTPLIHRFIPRLYSLLMSKDTFRELFEHYQPTLVFSTDVFSSNDCRLLLGAKARRVPTVGMVRSWDSLTTKGGFRVIPEVLVVPNEIVKKEALTIHHIPEAIIKVVGIPHYDNYLSGPTVSRNEFLARVGIPPDKRFFVYAPLGDRIVKVGDVIQKHTFDRDMIKLLSQLLPDPHYLLVRFPPTDTVCLDGLSPLPNVVFGQPGVQFGTGPRAIRQTELSPADDKHLINTLFYSDGLINVFSSLCLDAAVLGKPIIFVSFDPKPTTYWQSVKRIQEFDHLQPIFKTGWAYLAYTSEQLSRLIQTILLQPNDHEAERQRLIREQFYKLDGRSSERLATILESMS